MIAVLTDPEAVELDEPHTEAKPFKCPPRERWPHRDDGPADRIAFHPVARTDESRGIGVRGPAEQVYPGAHVEAVDGKGKRWRVAVGAVEQSYTLRSLDDERVSTPMNVCLIASTRTLHALYSVAGEADYVALTVGSHSPYSLCEAGE